MITVKIANEPSTYRAVAMVVGTTVAFFNPDLLEKCVLAATGVSGFIGLLFPDKEQ